MIRQAQFSKDRLYRYSLTIKWGKKGRLINFLMLNPSTADEEKNDPTVERCEQRARMWGYSGVIITNIFAYRSTDPKKLYHVADPIGVINDAVIMEAAVIKATGEVVCAWGTHGQWMGRGEQVAQMLREMGVTLTVLGLTASGQPCHPLYLSYELLPQAWER